MLSIRTIFSFRVRFLGCQGRLRAVSMATKCERKRGRGREEKRVREREKEIERGERKEGKISLDLYK